MIVETAVETAIPASTQEYLRPLGSFEELLWLMDKRSPLHATLIAHVDGLTEVEQWNAALQQTGKRHPLWSTLIAEGQDGRPIFQKAGRPEIPLRVVEGDFTQNWEQEVAWELSKPFDTTSGCLVRAVLLHTRTSCMLILVAHHSVCDGMSLAFAIRDTLQALSGEILRELRLHSSQEDSLTVCSQPRTQRRLVDHCLKPIPDTTVYRRSSSTIPQVQSLQLSSAFTATLRDRSRREETTLHAALLAASGIAARRSPDYGSGRDLHICSPINNRKLMENPEDSGVFFTACDSAIQDASVDDFWSHARGLKAALTPMQTAEGARAVLGAIDGVVQLDLDAAAAAEEGGRLFTFDVMLTNLGAVPIDSSYGQLSLKQVWGPGVLVGLEGEQTLGVSTFNGRLALLHTSHTPLPGFLDDIESILQSACAS